MNNENEIINKVIELIEDAYNPRESRKIINKEFPDYNDKNKLKTIIPEIIKHFDKTKRAAIKKTQFFKYFIVGEDKIQSK